MPGLGSSGARASSIFFDHGSREGSLAEALPSSALVAPVLVATSAKARGTSAKLVTTIEGSAFLQVDTCVVLFGVAQTASQSLALDVQALTTRAS